MRLARRPQACYSTFSQRAEVRYKAVYTCVAVALVATWCLHTTAIHVTLPSGGGQRRTAGSAMVVVEPRKHPLLRYVLHNFDKNMPGDYDLYIFHGPSAGRFARDAAAEIALHRQVFFYSLPRDNLIPAPHAYNAVIKSKNNFWDKINAENVLLFQTDTCLCSASTYTVRDFEHLGYIGCGTDGQAGRGTSHFNGQPFWGVGGLSFRHKTFALSCLASPLANKYIDEDVLFSSCVDKGMARAPAGGLDLAKFCTQKHLLAKSFGAHVTRNEVINQSDLSALLAHCPEARPLWELITGHNNRPQQNVE